MMTNDMKIDRIDAEGIDRIRNKNDAERRKRGKPNKMYIVCDLCHAEINPNDIVCPCCAGIIHWGFLRK